jgi:hypothetical protein
MGIERDADAGEGFIAGLPFKGFSKVAVLCCTKGWGVSFLALVILRRKLLTVRCRKIVEKVRRRPN